MNAEVLLRDPGIVPFRSGNKSGATYHSAYLLCGGRGKKGSEKGPSNRFHVLKEQNNGDNSYWSRGWVKKGVYLKIWIVASLSSVMTLFLAEGRRESKSFSMGSEKVPKNKPVNVEDKQPAPHSTVFHGYGCGVCGNRDYLQTTYNVCKFEVCGAEYSHISRFETHRSSVQVVNWLSPCPFYSSFIFWDSVNAVYFASCAYRCVTLIKKTRLANQMNHQTHGENL